MADPLISETRNAPVYAGLNPIFALLMCPGSVRTKSIVANLTLDATYPTVVAISPDAARTVTLDVIASSSGASRVIRNAAASAFNLTVANPAASTIGTLRAGEAGLFYCDGSAWSLVFVMPALADIPGASTAAAGTTTADATALPSGTSPFYPTTGADGTKGVRIATSDQVTGRTLFIGNGVSTAVLKVYAPSGGTINGAAADAAYSSASGKSVAIKCLDATAKTYLAVG